MNEITTHDPATTPEYHGAEPATDADYQRWIMREMNRLDCADEIDVTVANLVATFQDSQESGRYHAVEALAALREAKPEINLADDEEPSGFAGAWQALARLTEVPRDDT